MWPACESPSDHVSAVAAEGLIFFFFFSSGTPVKLNCLGEEGLASLWLNWGWEVKAQPFWAREPGFGLDFGKPGCAEDGKRRKIKQVKLISG